VPGDGPAGGGDETADRHDVATGATVGYVERNAGGEKSGKREGGEEDNPEADRSSRFACGGVFR
jgi:hypothetical protein